MNKFLVMVVVLLASPVLAITVERPLPKAPQEARAQTIFSALRCVVCEGQPLAESDAPLAIDMRQTIRNMVADGKSNADILHYFTTRYGDAILLNPPVNQTTLGLWVMPLLLLCGALWFVLRHFKTQAT